MRDLFVLITFASCESRINQETTVLLHFKSLTFQAQVKRGYNFMLQWSDDVNVGNNGFRSIQICNNLLLLFVC